jgi:hypothetical protein
MEGSCGIGIQISNRGHSTIMGPQLRALSRGHLTLRSETFTANISIWHIFEEVLIE